MERGYLKLWRKSLDSEVFASESLWRLWSWCLMKTTHKTRHIPMSHGRGEQIIAVNSGQFIFGRNKAADALGWSPSTLWKRMQKLEEIGCISIQSNNQYSIISICNWKDYQSEDCKKEQVSDSQVTSKEQVSDSAVTTKGQRGDTNKNVKNNKKEKIFDSVSFRPDFIPESLWSSFLENRKYKKLQNSELALKTACKQLRLAVDGGHDIETCIGRFVEGRWTTFKAEWMDNGKKQTGADGWVS